MRRSLLLLSNEPFAVLGLSRSCTKAEIKTRYRELARLHHPDSKTGDSKKMEEINKAYNLLLKEGAYERLRLKPAGTKRRDDARRPNPFSQEQHGQQQQQHHQYQDEEGNNDDVLSDFEAAKVTALDPSTERVTPEGKYMYQNRDDGSWMVLDRPLVRVHQPRYASFAAQADMSAELRRRSLEKEKEENAKTMFQRTVDRMSDSGDLPMHNRTMLYMCCILAIMAFYFVFQRSFAWRKHHRNRTVFYSSLEENREELMKIYDDHHDVLQTSVAAAALLFLTASEHKQELDPVVPPLPETYFKKVRPPLEHFHVVSGG
ncbi:putative DNA-J protein [Trypanosoma theileri]|uniref:Putative DNA-J protein n=1 Tax=Trypanosoma theileri TaxID=67003 RepID=A0A1X0P2Q0_9TRYP|nr:putative DNA-J protein [Trypanosoma theileri]ORC90829.1 putative DNA-J protein [Trypanosoma theileri]